MTDEMSGNLTGFRTYCKYMLIANWFIKITQIYDVYLLIIDF